MDIGETFVELPRVTSTHSRAMYSNLIRISDNMDFSSPLFYGRAKRKRSIGSAQAFVVELAMSDPMFREKLKKFMINGGSNFLYESSYHDRYLIRR